MIDEREEEGGREGGRKGGREEGREGERGWRGRERERENLTMKERLAAQAREGSRTANQVNVWAQA